MKAGADLLTIITGGAMSNKDAILRDGILRAKENGSRVLVVVPDQFSFEYDKMLYNLFGAKLFNSISVYGINRISEEIQKQHGCHDGIIADDNTKVISMYQSLKNLKTAGNVLYFQKNLNKPAFIHDMLNAVTELRQNDISPVDLENVSQKLDGAISEKLYDLSKILNFYNMNLADKGYIDGLSSVINTVKIARESNFFKNTEIFIDRFEAFSYDELKLIETMIAQSKNLSIALTISDENNSKSNMTPFLPTIKTKASFEAMANSIGMNIEYKKATEYYYNKKALTHVNANIFCLKNHKCDENNGVKVVMAQDFYDEVEFVSAEIKRLIREENLNYSDIAVISRQLSDYAPIIEGAFERYEIPTFIDKSENISKSVLAIYISAILDCVRGKTFNTEKILRMIKSPLSPFKDFQVSAIEEYCYCWNVEGDMWKAPFTAVYAKMDNLKTVNAIRKEIVEAIEDFRKSTINCSAGEMVNQFIKLINRFKIDSCANSLAKVSQGFEDTDTSFIIENSVEIQLIREFKQIWSMFNGALKSIYDNLAEEPISIKEFSDLFELLLSGMAVSNPPQRINTVTVASAEHSRLSSVKVVFVLGANVDRLPAGISKSGIFTDKEKNILIEAGVNVSGNAINQIHNERLITYLALTQGSDALYVCCPKADIQGKTLIPSIIVKELINMFGKEIIENANEKGKGFYCQTPRSAFSQYSECMNDRSVESETLRRALENFPEYKDKVRSLIENSKQVDFKISKENSSKLFFQENGDKREISISPSAIETYTKCPFMYFCNYGLGLFVPEKKEMNGINRGNIVHSVLEKILSSQNKEGIRIYNADFEKMDKEKIGNEIDKIFSDYLENEMGGDFGKTRRFYALMNRIKDNTVNIVLNVQQELIMSKFKPDAFEFKLTNERGKGIFKIETADIIIKIKGTIDRIDIFTDEDGKKYLKIVDYKTGTKLSLLSNIYNGLSLQLLIYLIALIEGDSDLNQQGDLIPAGIVYTPAQFINAETQQKTDYLYEDQEYIAASVEIGKKSIVKALARYGIVVDNKEVLQAMNENYAKSKFVPAERRTSNMLKSLSEYAKSRLEDSAKRLLDGEIQAQPLCEQESTIIKKPCTYCDFSQICGVKTKRPKRLISNKKDEKALIDLLSTMSDAEKSISGKGEGEDD